MKYTTLENYTNYEIYDNGMIISKERTGRNGWHYKRKEIRPTKAKNGYMTVRLTSDCGHIKQFYLHRLVYMAFNGEIGKLEVAHIDGNRSNCALSNLLAVTHTENCRSEVSRERYRMANSLDKGKFNRERMQKARTKEYYAKLVRTYKKLKQEHNRCGIMMLMKEGHCGYYRACRIIAEVEGLKK